MIRKIDLSDLQKRVQRIELRMQQVSHHMSSLETLANFLEADILELVDHLQKCETEEVPQ